MGDILLGILGGFGEATQRQNLMDMQAEIEKRKELASFWEKQASDESQRPEAREEAARRYLLIKRTPPGKPLPKEGKDLESWADVQLKSGKSLTPAQPVPVPPGQMPAATLPPSPGMDAGAPPIQAAPAPVAALAPPIPAPPRTAGPFITPGERNQQATEAIQSQVSATAQAQFQTKFANARAMIASGMDPDEAYTRAGLPQPRPEPRPKAYQRDTVLVDGKPTAVMFDPDPGSSAPYLDANTRKPVTGVITPMTSSNDTTFEQVTAARERIAAGKGTKHDQEIVKTWAEMHRPPQPQILYIPGMGLVNKQTGQKTADIDVPTSATRTMTEAAPKVVNFVDRIIPQIDAQLNQLGPAASRWNEFMTGKIGAPNPDFAKLRANTALLSTLLMRMHVGARGGQMLMEHFKDLMDVGRQSPENLKAALEEIKIYAKDVQGTKGAAEPTPPPGSDNPYRKKK